MDFLDVASQVARWLPANPLLVGEPRGTIFLPPILVPQFEEAVLRTIRNNFRNLIIAFTTCALVFTAVSLIRPASKALPFGLLMAMLSMTLAIDYFLALRHRIGVAERALFFHWLRVNSSAKRGVPIWLFIGVGAGALQWMLQQHLGGLDAVFHRYGVMYVDVENGEYWRLLTGSYLHYSAFHYLNNMALLILAGALTYALFGGSTVVVFVLGNVFSAFAQMTFGGSAFDNYGGVSGGVYALLGVLIVAGAMNRSLLPKGFWWLVTNLTVLGLLTSEILSANTATVAHLSGFLFGGLAGIYYGHWR